MFNTGKEGRFEALRSDVHGLRMGFEMEKGKYEPTPRRPFEKHEFRQGDKAISQFYRSAAEQVIAGSYQDGFLTGERQQVGLWLLDNEDRFEEQMVGVVEIDRKAQLVKFVGVMGGSEHFEPRIVRGIWLYLDTNDPEVQVFLKMEMLDYSNGDNRPLGNVFICDTQGHFIDHGAATGWKVEDEFEPILRSVIAANWAHAGQKMTVKQVAQMVKDSIGIARWQAH